MPEGVEHMDEEHQPYIAFTVKELLVQINQRLDTMTTMLANKADRGEVISLADRVDQLTDRLTTMEHSHQLEEKHHENTTTRFRWVIDAAIALLAVAALVASIVLHG